MYKDISGVILTGGIDKRFNEQTKTKTVWNSCCPESNLKTGCFCISGDMPFLEKNLIVSEAQMFAGEKCDALVPQVNDFTEPLHSIYSISILNNLEKYLNESGNYAVREFLKRIDVKYMKLPDSDVTIRSFININYPSDLTAFDKPYL